MMDPIRAMLFYQVNDTSSSKPPPVSNDIWSLDDGGRWKSMIDFPVYALPGATATDLMIQLSLYSGNASTAPDGKQLTAMYGDDGAARLYADISVGMCHFLETV